MSREQVQRVRIYLRQGDTWNGEALYKEVLNRLRREGASGATVLQGLAGFGPGYRVRTSARPMDSESLPLVIEWIDRPERISRTLPLLDEILPGALMTIDHVQIHSAVLRQAGAFGVERSVGDLAARDILTARATMPAREVIGELLARNQPALPVLNDAGHVIGLVSWTQVAQRGQVAPTLRALRAMSPDERERALQPLARLVVGQVMVADPRCLFEGMPVAQAVGAMLEWSYEALPVVGHDGRALGLFCADDALQAAHATLPVPPPPSGEPATMVQMFMQTSTTPLVIDQEPGAALAQLLGAPDLILPVVDSTGHVAGLLSDASVLAALDPPARAAWYEQLLNATPPPASVALPGLDRGLRDFVLTVPTLTTTTPLSQALAALLAGPHERLPVASDDGRLLGIVGRGSLLRALAQER